VRTAISALFEVAESLRAGSRFVRREAVSIAHYQSRTQRSVDRSARGFTMPSESPALICMA
jgi:hypothetical protein